jgi:hypothetical protein
VGPCQGRSWTLFVMVGGRGEGRGSSSDADDLSQAGRPWLHGGPGSCRLSRCRRRFHVNGRGEDGRRRPERCVGLLLKEKRPRRRREGDSEPGPWTQPPQAESPSKPINCVGSATLRALAGTGAAGSLPTGYDDGERSRARPAWRRRRRQRWSPSANPPNCRAGPQAARAPPRLHRLRPAGHAIGARP